jgi:HD-GYP domain-containing protein (c-di-GMP phosphodiesterase class II)
MPNEKKITVEIPVQCLSPGIVFPFNACDAEDHPVIPRHTTLSREKIHEIKAKGIEKLFYERDFNSVADPGPNSPVSKESLQKAVSFIEDVRKNMAVNKPMPLAGYLNEIISYFTREIFDFDKGTISLFDAETFDDYPVTHAINVTILSILTSHLMKQEEFRVRKIGMGSMVFDIGMFMIPKEIREKTTELSDDDWKAIKQHPIHSYNYLKNDKSIDAYVLNAVLFHHELYSGGGYPLGVTYEKSNELAQMIMLSDVFDAALSPKPYRKPRQLSDTFSYLLKYSGIRFNPREARAFLYYVSKRLGDVPVFPVDSYVILDTGEIGIVTNHPHDLYSLRPMIRIFINTRKQEKVLKYEIPLDLEQDYDRKIVERIVDPQFITNLDKIRERYKNAGMP